MATAGTVWEVRPSSGSDGNGGGFDPTVTSPGTDYSQQNSAQITYTDLIIGGTTTQLTSVLNPFTSAHVGNVIQITSGSGFNVGFYIVVSVSGITATMHFSVGSAASTGGHGTLGGALANLTKLFTSSSGTTQASQGNVVYVNGTTTLTSTLNVTKASSGNFERIVIRGYGTTRNDGTNAIITTATNSTSLITCGGQGIEFRNLTLTNTAGTPAAGLIGNGSNVIQVTLRDCILSGFTLGVDGSSAGNFIRFYLIETEIKNCTSHGVNNGDSIIGIGAYIHNNGGDGLHISGNGEMIMINTVSANNTGIGFSDVGSGNFREMTFKQCIAYNNGSDGIKITQGSSTQGIIAVNNIIYNNAGFGINCAGVITPSSAPCTQLVQLNNAFGSNTSGNRNTNFPSDTSDLALTANPFNNAGTGDFSLNSTSGGGPVCSGAGWQSSII